MTNAEDIKIKILSKWNYEKHIYVPWLVTNNVAMYKENLEDMVDCCKCGKRIKYGDSYTSLVIHNPIGLGYAVCEKCYEKERKERRKYKDDKC